MKHEISELLPFYANDTLDGDERARVEHELATCAECAEELRELRAIAQALRARGASARPLPPHVLDSALARINTPSLATASAKVRSAWWGTPARYATAAALVVGFSAAAVGAWHVRESNVDQATAGSGNAVSSTMVYRVTPAPAGAAKSEAAKRPLSAAERVTYLGAVAQPPQTVAKAHRLARKARLELLVRDVEAALKGAQATVRGAGGDVTALNDASPRTADAVHGATLELEVPADRLDATLDRLAQLGAVQNRAVDAEDLDASIVDQEARLRNLRRAENDLRALMDRGGKVTDILTVQQNLTEVRGQIEQLDAAHQHDLHRVTTGTISVTLTEDRPNATPAKPGPTARIDGAWHSGLGALADAVVAIVSTIVWSIAYAPLPLACAGLVYAGMRLLGKKRATAP